MEPTEKRGGKTSGLTSPLPDRLMQLGHSIQHHMARPHRPGAFQPDRPASLVETVGTSNLLARIGTPPSQIVAPSTPNRGEVDKRRLLAAFGRHQTGRVLCRREYRCTHAGQDHIMCGG